MDFWDKKIFRERKILAPICPQSPSSSPLSPNEFYLHMFHILKRFGKAAIAVELTAVGGLFYIFHEINTGGSEARSKWDDRLPFLIDAFYNMTGDERVIAHRTNRSKNDDN